MESSRRYWLVPTVAQGDRPCGSGTAIRLEGVFLPHMTTVGPQSFAGERRSRTVSTSPSR